MKPRREWRHLGVGRGVDLLYTALRFVFSQNAWRIKMKSAWRTFHRFAFAATGLLTVWVGSPTNALAVAMTSTAGGEDVQIFLVDISLDTLISFQDANTLGGVAAMASHTQFLGGLNSVEFIAAGTAQAVANSNFGTLGAAVLVTASASPTAFSFITQDGDTATLTNPLTVFSGGRGNAQFSDTLTITSASLALGTPVTLQAHLALHSLFLTAGCCFGNVNGAAGARMDFLETFQGVVITESGLNVLPLEVDSTLASNGFVSNTPPSQTASMLIPGRVGATLDIHGLLGVHGSINAGLFACGSSPCPDPFENASLTVDARNTASFTIDVLDPGATYTTLSGHTYFTQGQPSVVPAPPTLLLLTSGLVALLARTHRRAM